MSAPFVPDASQLNTVKEAVKSVQHYFGYVKKYAVDLKESGEVSQRGDLRSEEDNPEVYVERKSWQNRLPADDQALVARTRLQAPPTMSTEGDLSEFGFSQWSHFDATDELEISPRECPETVRLEVIHDGSVFVNLMKTVLWENDKASPLLRDCLGHAREFLLGSVRTGVNLSALDKDGLLNVLPTQYGEVRIQTAVVQRMGALSSCRDAGIPAFTELLSGLAVENQVFGMHLMLRVQIEEGKTYWLAFEDVFRVGANGSSLVGPQDAESYIFAEGVRAWQDAPLWVLSSYTCDSNLNPFWNGNNKKAKLPDPQSRSYASTPLEDIAGMSREAMCLMIFRPHSPEGASIAFDHLRSLALLMLCQARPVNKNLITNDIVQWMLKNSARYNFSEEQLEHFAKKHTGYIIRKGQFDTQIDLPALRRARDVMAKMLQVTSHEVARFAQVGPEAYFDETLDHPHFGELPRQQQEDPKFQALRALYLLYSGRVVPWTAITGSELSSLMVTTTDIIRRNMPDTISLDKSL